MGDWGCHHIFDITAGTVRVKEVGDYLWNSIGDEVLGLAKVIDDLEPNDT